jgi:hypothetical protein
MINLAAVSSASGAGQYYSQDNYYTSSELTEASQWVGSGAEALDLRGRVAKRVLWPCWLASCLTAAASPLCMENIVPAST